jgi:hypothetical protein
MNRLAALAASVISAVSLAQDVKVDCPAGMHFVTNKGCVANIQKAAPACPGGTHLEGNKCVANIDTSCPAGMHFVTGTGCVANSGGGAVATTATPPPPPPPPERPAPAAEEESNGKKKKGGTFQSGFSNRLQANCAGIPFEVHGGARFTGVRAMLLVDGTKMGDDLDVNVGETKSITGAHGKKNVELKVQQGLWGTRYTLKVDGVECKLTK